MTRAFHPEEPSLVNTLSPTCHEMGKQCDNKEAGTRGGEQAGPKQIHFIGTSAMVQGSSTLALLTFLVS